MYLILKKRFFQYLFLEIFFCILTTGQLLKAVGFIQSLSDEADSILRNA
jgi:hypothetical protein